MAEVIEAAGFLLFHPGAAPCFLLMQHPQRWDLPKGHAEPGEDLLQTAVRETAEETGILAEQITVDREFRCVLEYQVTHSKRGNYLKRVTYFLGYLAKPLPATPSEHIGFRWFDWPPEQPLQAETIDPLLAAVASHFKQYPQRVLTYS